MATRIWVLLAFISVGVACTEEWPFNRIITVGVPPKGINATSGEEPAVEVCVCTKTDLELALHRIGGARDTESVHDAAQHGEILEDQLQEPVRDQVKPSSRLHGESLHDQLQEHLRARSTGEDGISASVRTSHGRIVRLQDERGTLLSSFLDVDDYLVWLRSVLIQVPNLEVEHEIEWVKLVNLNDRSAVDVYGRSLFSDNNVDMILYVLEYIAECGGFLSVPGMLEQLGLRLLYVKASDNIIIPPAFPFVPVDTELTGNDGTWYRPELFMRESRTVRMTYMRDDGHRGYVMAWEDLPFFVNSIHRFTKLRVTHLSRYWMVITDMQNMYASHQYVYNTNLWSIHNKETVLALLAFIERRCLQVNKMFVPGYIFMVDFGLDYLPLPPAKFLDLTFFEDVSTFRSGRLAYIPDFGNVQIVRSFEDVLALRQTLERITMNLKVELQNFYDFVNDACMGRQKKVDFMILRNIRTKNVKYVYVPWLWSNKNKSFIDRIIRFIRDAATPETDSPASANARLQVSERLRSIAVKDEERCIEYPPNPRFLLEKRLKDKRAHFNGEFVDYD